MSDQLPVTVPAWKAPLLCVIALLMVLGMLRLGVWQLDRAEQKRELVTQLETLSQQAAVPISELFSLDESVGLRFRKVMLKGKYLQDTNFYVDNQVINGRVGYQVFTPFQLEGHAPLVMVARGWVSVGESRESLPDIVTDSDQVILAGRLNAPPAKPPLWNEQYSASEGDVWQYLPMAEVAGLLRAKVYPLVVELTASDSNDDQELLRKWPKIDDQQVAKHLGYAFQWFAMALAFFIACLVLVFRSYRIKQI